MNRSFDLNHWQVKSSQVKSSKSLHVFTAKCHCYKCFLQVFPALFEGRESDCDCAHLALGPRVANTRLKNIIYHRKKQKTRWSSHIDVCKDKITKKWPTIVASLMLIACLFAESIQPPTLFWPLPTHYDLASRSRS